MPERFRVVCTMHGGIQVLWFTFLPFVPLSSYTFAMLYPIKRTFDYESNRRYYLRDLGADRWPSLAHKLSYDITTTQVNPCIPSGSLNRVPVTARGKGRKFTAARWQITLCDPLWHATSGTRSCTKCECNRYVIKERICRFYRYFWSVDSLENHWTCCRQMSYFKAKMHQIRFRLGLRPRPR